MTPLPPPRLPAPQAGSLTSRTILQQVQELLQGRGCGPVQVDQAVWTLSWGLQVRGLVGGCRPEPPGTGRTRGFRGLAFAAMRAQTGRV